MENEIITENRWKILVADDEEEVHIVTKMVLSSFRFENRGVQIYSTYNAAETRKCLQENSDIALVLLDVVMDEDDSGLQVVKWIRDEQKNPFIRIVLRTGQPGYAPEDEVVKNYDINDYKEKTELTSQKLYTVVYSALRAFKELKTIERSRQGLAEIVKASASLFEIQSLKRFVKGMLEQLTSLLGLLDTAMYANTSGLAVSENNSEYVIVAATGKFSGSEGRLVEDVIDQTLLSAFREALKKELSSFTDNIFIGFYKSSSNHKNLVILQGTGEIPQTDRDLLTFFNANISVAFENIYLNKEIEDTQREIIQTLVEVIESRSKETLNHVKRVGLFSKIMGHHLGMSEKDLLLLRSAAALHDIGKIAFPDSLLQKQGKLTESEFLQIQTHTEIGHVILKNSQWEMMKHAATIALQHHERWDGLGYPQKLTGEEIHVWARITQVADVFDSMRKKRAYSKVHSHNEIQDFFQLEKGRIFDPALVDILLKNYEDFKAIEERYPD